MEQYKKITGEIGVVCKEFGYSYKEGMQGGDIYLGRDSKYGVTVHEKGELTIMSYDGSVVEGSELIEKLLKIDVNKKE
jgi:hypothetical protein